MKHRPFIVAVVVFMAALAFSNMTRADEAASNAGKNKLALLIGIDNYQAAIPGNNRDVAYFHSLHCSLDSQNLKRTLTSERYGFKPENVRVLKDEESTRLGMIQAFEELIAKAQPGDTVVFLYSGHGDTVKDDNGDEIDGYDEVLVPYDWNNNDDNSYLRDDEIQRLLGELNKKMTRDGQFEGNVTLLFDCCHSGTVSRGRLIAKGRGSAPAVREGGIGKGATQTNLPGSGYDADATKPYVLISACQSDESAYETYGPDDEVAGGALVYNFCQLLNEPDINPNMSYRELYDRLKIQVKADKNSQRQTPVIEGQIDKKLFGGENVETLSTVRVADVDEKTGAITLNAGRLQGVANGAKYAIYKLTASAKEPGEPIAQATVQNVDVYSAQAITADGKGKTLTKAQLLGAPLVLTEYPAEDRLKVLLDGTGDLEAALKDKQTPAAQDPLQFVAAPAGTAAGIKAAARSGQPRGGSTPAPTAVRYDYYIAREPAVKGAGGQELVLRRADDTVIQRVPDDNAAALRQRLVREWRWQTLVPVDASVQSDASEVDLKIIPYVPEQTNSKGVPKGKIEDKAPAANGQVTLRAGDYFRIEVTNNTPSNLWVTIINIDSEGRMSPVFPYPNKYGQVEQEVNYLKAGDTLKLNPPQTTLIAQAPLGTDVYKVLATQENVNFMPLLDPPSDSETRDTKGAEDKRRDAIAAAKGTRGPVSALANLLMNASLGTRAPKVITQTADWYVVTKTVETLPAASAAGKGTIPHVEKGRHQ